jgi:hypothetical protein
MSDTTLLVILVIPMVLALAFGVWAGLGYPGKQDKYATTGKAPREVPVNQLLTRMRRRTERDADDEAQEPDEAASAARTRRIQLERKSHWRGPGRR